MSRIFDGNSGRETFYRADQLCSKSGQLKDYFCTIHGVEYVGLDAIKDYLDLSESSGSTEPCEPSRDLTFMAQIDRELKAINTISCKLVNDQCCCGGRFGIFGKSFYPEC